MAPTSATEEDSTSISDGADGRRPPSRLSNPPLYGLPTAPPDAPPSATPLTPPYGAPTAPPDTLPSATPLTSPISIHTRSKTAVAAPISQPSTSQPAPTPSTSQPVLTYPTGQSVPTSPASLLAHPREVAGAEGVVGVHLPFSLADLSKIEERLGDFSANPT